MTDYKSIVNVDSVYYALITQDDDNGYVAGTPKFLSRTMELKGSPEVSTETQYADGGVNDVASAEGPTVFDATFPEIPEDTLAELLGMVNDSASGRIFDDADPALAPYFALGYRFKKSNGKYRYRWYLRARAEKPGEEAVSESDKVDLKPAQLKITCVKTLHKFDLLGNGSRVKAVKRVHGDEGLANFSGTTWFAAVQQPIPGTPSALTCAYSPLDGATGVAINANVTLTFNNPLAGGSEAGIALVNADTQAPVAVARTINAARTVVTLDPSSNLANSTEYLVVVHDIVDIHGQSLANAVVNFETVAP
jgi:phi13 family phage major tail protein